MQRFSNVYPVYVPVRAVKVNRTLKNIFQGKLVRLLPMPSEMAVEVQEAARNIYPFALEVYQIDADVHSLPGQKKMFRGTSQDTISLGPGAEEDLALRFTARPSEAMGGLGTLARIFTQGNQPVKVAGTLQLSAFAATFTLLVEQEVTVSAKDLGLPNLLDIFKVNWYHTTLMQLIHIPNHLTKPLLLAVVLQCWAMLANGQPTPEQWTQAEEIVERYCTLSARLAANGQDDPGAFGALNRHVFANPINNSVYNDLLPGETETNAAEYLRQVQMQQGSLRFDNGAP